MEHQVILSRIHFAFTIMFHYIFPQLTMGLALDHFRISRTWRVGSRRKPAGSPGSCTG
jgi:cytochrome bd-type quinol oxidase subunit 1